MRRIARIRLLQSEWLTVVACVYVCELVTIIAQVSGVNSWWYGDPAMGIPGRYSESI